MSPTPAPCAAVNHECSRRFDVLEHRLDVVDDRQRTQGEKLASLEGKVAAWAALGSLAGGALVTALSRFLK